MRLVCQLRGARERTGESLRAVAERTGIFRGQLSEIERGIRLPRDGEAETLARLYGLTIEEFYAPAPHAMQVGLVPDERPPPGDTRVTTDERETVRQTRALEKEIAELLGDGVRRTAAEIAERAKGGIGCRRKDVEACLLSNGRLFTSTNGREVGRSPRATLYRLMEGEALVAADESEWIR